MPYGVPHRDNPLNAWRDALQAWITTLAARMGRAGHDGQASWTLTARPSAVRTARRLTAARLTAWGLREQAAGAACLTGELVGDALGHGAAAIRLTLDLEDGLLRCEVEAIQAPPLPYSSPRPPALPVRLPVCCWGVSGQIAWYELVTAGYNARHHLDGDLDGG